jgi:hypothetical protein
MYLFSVYKVLEITGFRLSRWFVIDVSSVLELLPHVAVGDIADVSKLITISIITVEGCILVSWLWITLHSETQQPTHFDRDDWDSIHTT